MNFPEGFVKKYEEILGDEARAFLASFDDEAISAFRSNPLKKLKALSLTLFLTHLGATMEKYLGNLLNM